MRSVIPRGLVPPSGYPSSVGASHPPSVPLIPVGTTFLRRTESGRPNLTHWFHLIHLFHLFYFILFSYFFRSQVMFSTKVTVQAGFIHGLCVINHDIPTTKLKIQFTFSKKSSAIITRTTNFPPAAPIVSHRLPRTSVVVALQKMLDNFFRSDLGRVVGRFVFQRALVVGDQTNCKEPCE